jgi:hypothetical protein
VLAADLECAVEAALVGDQDRELPAALAEPLDQHGHELRGVGQLRHPLRVDEAGRLHDRQPGGDEPADELRLVGTGTTVFSFCRPSRGPTS